VLFTVAAEVVPSPQATLTVSVSAARLGAIVPTRTAGVTTVAGGWPLTPGMTVTRPPTGMLAVVKCALAIAGAGGVTAAPTVALPCWPELSVTVPVIV
jgi:hypothetical protein